MSTPTMIRWAACAAVLLMLPVPAEAQIGRFLKKKLKAAIVQTVVADATAQASPVPADSGEAAPAVGSAPAPVTAAPRARKGMPGSTSKPSIFSSSTLEMTAELLDRFEKGVAAELAERKAVAPQLARLLPNDKFQKCLRAKALPLPAGQKAQKEYLTALQSGRQELYQGAAEKFNDELERVGEPACGLSPTKGDSLRRALEERPEEAGVKAAGLEKYQYYILKERILPFCTLTGTPEMAGEFVRLSSSYVYTQGEAAALRPRCARLTAALK